MDSLVGNDRLAMLEHRGHSGDRDDRVIHELDQDTYLRLCAEMHARAIVEAEKSLGRDVTMVGSHYFDHGGHAAPRRTPHQQGGHFVAGGVSVAYDLQVDSIGQEAWVLHLGYISSAQLDRWVRAKIQLCNELAFGIDLRCLATRT
jgi:hypothetical protein